MEKPKTIIVDIDGTISTSAGRREPFDLKKVIHDDPINSVIEVIQALEDCQYVIVYLLRRPG
jgi:histidinol phosphatase-like enzyme